MQILRACVFFVSLTACGSSGGGGSAAGDGASGTGGSAGNGATGGSDASVGGAGGVAGAISGGGSGGTGGAIADAGLILGPEDIACADLAASAGACISCCSDVHATWETVAPATRTCVCESPGSCTTECTADYCQAQPGSPGCYACIFPTLVPGAACYAPSQTACAGDSDCLIYVDCRANCVLAHPGT